MPATKVLGSKFWHFFENAGASFTALRMH